MNLSVKNMQIGLLLLVIMGCLHYSLSGQVVLEDVVYLKNGSVLRGKIVEQEVGEYIKLEFLGGSLLVIEQEKIEKVTQEPSRYRSIVRVLNYPPRPLLFYEKGLYKAISGSFSFSEGNWGQARLDLSLNYRMGYRFNRFVGLGAGAGMDGYLGGLILPAFVDWHGDLSKKYLSPYYHFQFGYGFGAVPGGRLDEIRGGWMSYGALGVKVRTKSPIEWVFTLGYKSQENVEREIITGGLWSPRERTIIERSVVYRRFAWQTSFFF